MGNDRIPIGQLFGFRCSETETPWVVGESAVNHWVEVAKPLNWHHFPVGFRNGERANRLAGRPDGWWNSMMVSCRAEEMRRQVSGWRAKRMVCRIESAVGRTEINQNQKRFDVPTLEIRTDSIGQQKRLIIHRFKSHLSAKSYSRVTAVFACRLRIRHSNANRF